MDPWSLPKTDRDHSLLAVHPEARPEFQRLIDYATDQGWTLYISSATRGFAQQASTASLAPCGWHQFGRAIDVDLNGSIAWNPETYGQLIDWWESQSSRHQTGEKWTKYGPHGDFAHFQFVPIGYERNQPPGAELCGSHDQGTLDAYWQAVGEQYPSGYTAESTDSPESVSIAALLTAGAAIFAAVAALRGRRRK